MPAAMTCVAETVDVIAPGINLFVRDELFPTLLIVLAGERVLIDVSQGGIFPLSLCRETIVGKKDFTGAV